MTMRLCVIDGNDPCAGVSMLVLGDAKGLRPGPACLEFAHAYRGWFAGLNKFASF